MDEKNILVVVILGFGTSYAAIGVLPKFLYSRKTGMNLPRLLLAFVIAFSTSFLLYYRVASFTFLEATTKSAVVAIITIIGAFICIYLARNDIQN